MDESINGGRESGRWTDGNEGWTDGHNYMDSYMYAQNDAWMSGLSKLLINNQWQGRMRTNPAFLEVKL